MPIVSNINNIKSINYQSGGVIRAFAGKFRVFDKSVHDNQFTFVSGFPDNEERVLYVDDISEISCSGSTKYRKIDEDNVFKEFDPSDILVPDSQNCFKRYKFTEYDVLFASIILNGARYIRFNGFDVTFTPDKSSRKLTIHSNSAEIIDFDNMIFYGIGTLVLDCPNLRYIRIKNGLLNQRYHEIPENVQIFIIG